MLAAGFFMKVLAAGFFEVAMEEACFKASRFLEGGDDDAKLFDAASFFETAGIASCCVAARQTRHGPKRNANAGNLINFYGTSNTILGSSTSFK